MPKPIIRSDSYLLFQCRYSCFENSRPPLPFQLRQCTLFVNMVCLLTDIEIDMKACISCISFILTSAVRFNCDHNALHSELQQLGLPREHSTSIKRIVGDYHGDIATTLRNQTLKGCTRTVETSIAVITTNCSLFQLMPWRRHPQTLISKGSVRLLIY